MPTCFYPGCTVEMEKHRNGKYAVSCQEHRFVYACWRNNRHMAKARGAQPHDILNYLRSHSKWLDRRKSKTTRQSLLSDSEQCTHTGPYDRRSPCQSCSHQNDDHNRNGCVECSARAEFAKRNHSPAWTDYGKAMAELWETAYVSDLTFS